MNKKNEPTYADDLHACRRLAQLARAGHAPAAGVKLVRVCHPEESEGADSFAAQEAVEAHQKGEPEKLDNPEHGTRL